MRNMIKFRRGRTSAARPAERSLLQRMTLNQQNAARAIAYAAAAEVLG